VPTPLSVSQVAQRTGISKRTIQDALHRGDLKAEKFPGLTGAYLIEETDLLSWLINRAS